MLLHALHKDLAVHLAKVAIAIKRQVHIVLHLTSFDNVDTALDPRNNFERRTPEPATPPLLEDECGLGSLGSEAPESPHQDLHVRHGP